MWIVWTHIQDGLCPKDQIRAGGVPRRRMHNHNRRSLQDKLREKFLQFSSHLSNAQETKTVKLTGKECSTTYQKKECTLKTGVVTRTKLQRNAMFSLILTSTFMADSNYTHEGGVSVPGASLILANCQNWLYVLTKLWESDWGHWTSALGVSLFEIGLGAPQQP